MKKLLYILFLFFTTLLFSDTNNSIIKTLSTDDLILDDILLDESSINVSNI
jgi:hypothetical protein